MASFKKRGKTWTAEIRLKINNRFFYESKTFRTKGEAVAWANEREQEIEFGNIDFNKHTFTLKDALIRYATEESPRNKDWKKEQQRIRRFINDDRLDTDCELRVLTSKMFADYRRARREEVSDSTVNRDISLLRSVFRVAISEWEWMKYNPLVSISQLKENPSRSRRVSLDEIKLLQETCQYTNGTYPRTQQQVVFLMFCFALETAMRQGEIAEMKWETTYLDNRYCHVEETKNGDSRDVPLNSRARAILQVMRPVPRGDVWPIKKESVTNSFRWLKSRANIDSLRFHDARHEATTNLARKVDVLNLARITGHKDTKSLMIYYNPTASELADLLD